MGHGMQRGSSYIASMPPFWPGNSWEATLFNRSTAMVPSSCKMVQSVRMKAEKNFSEDGILKETEEPRFVGCSV